MSISRVTSSKPLPEKVGAVVQEARWLLVGLLGIYLGIILFGFNIADPGWSHAATV
ncbi:MAG TPA: DNA translocase FtsK 4TM domain-containing protein, partial [Rugosibacter sp.]|nr:DNA translocase FtsK 4TM domain-containing protein [Rugosibacter sp.]